MGTKAKHHLKGYIKQFKPKIADDIWLALPTKTIDLSKRTAARIFKKVFKEKNENN